EVLVVVSAAELATGIGGVALALRRRHAFDLPFWHGRESAVGHDSLLMGTALSAPAVMLGAQAGAITALLRGPSPAARRLLGGLGAAMAAGYVAERLVRHRLPPSGRGPAGAPRPRPPARGPGGPPRPPRRTPPRRGQGRAAPAPRPGRGAGGGGRPAGIGRRRSAGSGRGSAARVPGRYLASCRPGKLASLAT